MWGSQAAQAKASVILQTPNHGAQGPGACVILGLAFESGGKFPFSVSSK